MIHPSGAGGIPIEQRGIETAQQGLAGLEPERVRPIHDDAQRRVPALLGSMPGPAA